MRIIMGFCVLLLASLAQAASSESQPDPADDLGNANELLDSRGLGPEQGNGHGLGHDPQAPPGIPVSNQATIRDSSSGFSGNVGINQAAGDQQQQSNSRAIAVGSDAQATTRVQQTLNIR